MPQYHHAKVDRFLVKTKPIFFLRKWFPYFVGNEITFMIQIEDTEQRIDSTSLHVFEVFGEREQRIKGINREALPSEWIIISGNPIDREGDVIYRLGASPNSKDSMVLLSAHVMNTDRWMLGCAGLVIGAILTIATGIILGFIQITPFWKIWIP